MRSSSPITFAPYNATVQHRLTDSMLRDDAMKEQVIRLLAAPIQAVPHGAKRFCPHLTQLIGNVERETNHAGETITTVMLAHLYLRGLDVARALPRTLDAMLCARSPFTPVVIENIEDLNQLETELQGAFDQIQTKLWRKDFSTRTMMDALDTLYEIRKLVDRMIDWFERRLYGAKQ